MRSSCQFLNLSLSALVAVLSSATSAHAENKTTRSKPQEVVMKPQPAFWSKEANLISYACKDMKLTARSKNAPGTTYKLTDEDALFNAKDCKASVASLQKKGCFCDDADLKCLETEKIEPWGIVCPSLFMCFKFQGETTGVVRVATLDNHITRKACEKELTDLERN